MFLILKMIPPLENQYNALQSKQEEKKNIIAYILKHVILKPRTYMPVSFNFKVAKEILHLDSLFFLLMVQNYSIK